MTYYDQLMLESDYLLETLLNPKNKHSLLNAEDEKEKDAIIDDVENTLYKAKQAKSTNGCLKALNMISAAALGGSLASSSNVAKIVSASITGALAIANFTHNKLIVEKTKSECAKLVSDKLQDTHQAIRQGGNTRVLLDLRDALVKAQKEVSSM